MSLFTPLNAGLSAVALAAGLSGGAALLPPVPFMKVHGVTVAGGDVIADRKVRKFQIADWRVWIVAKDGKGPSCSTVIGPREGQGWNDYAPGARSELSFALDVWVGDDGCADRLEDEDYAMFINWTPRDGGPVVTYKTSFHWKPGKGASPVEG